MFDDIVEQLAAIDSNAPVEERIAERDRLAAIIRDRARQDPDGMRAYLDAVDVMDREQAAGYAEVVEALCGDSKTWHDLLVRHAEQTMQTHIERGYSTLHSPMNGFDFGEDNERFRAAILPVFLRGLAEGNEALRVDSIHCIAGYSVSKSAEIRAALEHALTDDPSWKVRKEAEWLLNDEQLLPHGYKTPLWDRFRRWFSGS